MNTHMSRTIKAITQGLFNDRRVQNVCKNVAAFRQRYRGEDKIFGY